MPIYEYLCAACNEKFSVFQKSNSPVNDTKCPKCDSREIRKVMSSFSCSAGSAGGGCSSMPSRGFSGGG